ncbi:MAG: hypothetical protein KKB59_15790 [Spirochaetes bacterium]|nr:hypothetical protein [Spirochaetota bacterium]
MDHTRVVPEGEDRTSLRERWIPNTGEYLRFNAYITLRNAAGVALEPDVFFPDGVKVAIGAKDRNFDAAEAGDSNIRTNRGTGFSLSGGFGNGASFQFLGELKPSGATYERSGSGVFRLSSSGLVVAKSGAAEGYACIRPLQADGTRWIRPGDDVILTATLARDDDTPITTTALETPASDYLAVYDKKMLWRANLYIDETQAEKKDDAGVVTQARVVDWNELHPWNAPPAANAALVGGPPEWGKGEGGAWDANWGYNEWNRKFSLEQAFNGSATVGLTNLPAGDGKQVVVLPSFTPVRTLKTDVGNVTAENVIGGTVAYSYPKHGYETISSWGGTPPSPKLAVKGDRQSAPAWDYISTGNPGSMDSPFDFVWKMRQQKADIGDGAVQGQAPGNSWWDYVVTKPAGALGSDLNPGDIRYIPSLGLYLSFPWHELNEGFPGLSELNTGAQDESDDPDLWKIQTELLPLSPGSTIKILFLDGVDTHQKRRNASWIVEAGADCIGFAQKAASYSGRSYAWVPLPKGLMDDAGEANIYTVMDRYHLNTVPIGYRVYPIAERSSTYGDTVVRRVVTPIGTAQPAIEELRRIVPGDIFVKDSTTLPEAETDDHIAIVAYVPPNACELSATDLMSQIILIEGEFTNKIQSVIKKLSVGMYNGVGIPVGTEIYTGFTVEDQMPNTPQVPDPINLNCQSWAIRRLK